MSNNPMSAFGQGDLILSELVRKIAQLPDADRAQIMPDIDRLRIYIATVATDITVRNQAEEKFAKAFYSNPTAMAITRIADGCFLDVNEAFFQMTGFTREEVIGHTGIELGLYRSPADRQKLVGLLQEKGSVRNYELPVRHKAGEIRTDLFFLERIELGGEACVLTTVLDITQRKLHEIFGRTSNEIQRIIHSSLDFDKVLNRSIAAAGVALGCDTAGLSLRKDGHWVVSGVYGLPDEMIGMVMDDDQERHAMLAIQTKKPLPVDDAFNDERFNREHLRRYNIRSVLVMPVIMQDEAIGVVFFNYQKSAFTFQQVHVDFAARVAAALSSALENAQLYQNLEKEIAERKLVEAEQIRAKAEIEVQRRLMDQREQERLAIAQDLHDGPIQNLSSSIFHLQLIKEVFPEPALELELNQIGRDIKNSIHEIRAVLNDLRPPALMHFGFSRMIQMFAQDLRERFPEIGIELDIMDDQRALSEQVVLALYRILQAGINNIIRHSGASKSWVTYKIVPGSFYFALRDNGKGFALTRDFTQLTRNGHFGLVGMKERAEAIGATFSVSTEPGEGTTIVVQGPLSGMNYNL